MQVNRSQSVVVMSSVAATLGAAALVTGLIATFGRFHAAHVASQQISKYLGQKGQMALMISGGTTLAVAMTVLGVNRYLASAESKSPTKTPFQATAESTQRQREKSTAVNTQLAKNLATAQKVLARKKQAASSLETQAALESAVNELQRNQKAVQDVLADLERQL